MLMLTRLILLPLRNFHQQIPSPPSSQPVHLIDQLAIIRKIHPWSDSRNVQGCFYKIIRAVSSQSNPKHKLMNTHHPSFSLELLLNTPYHPRGGPSLDYCPRQKSEISKQKSNRSPVLGSPLSSQTPLLNKSKQFLQGTRKTSQDYLQFLDNCSMYLSKKQKGQPPEQSKSGHLNAMFRNIKEVLKQNDKNQKKASLQKELDEKQSPKKEGFLVMRSHLHNNLYASEQKMQFYRLTRAANEYSNHTIKNSMRQSNQKYILNPFAESSSMECKTAVLSQQNRQRQLEKMVESSILQKNNTESLKSRRIIPVQRSSFQRSMSFNLSGQLDGTYPKKIKNYLEFLFKVNYSNQIYVDLTLARPEEMSQVKKQKAFIGRGNNALLVESVMKRRFWWEITHVDNGQISFYWSQNTIQKIHRLQKKSQKESDNRIRGGSGEAEKTKKINKEVYELNLKILNRQDSRTVERYLMNESICLPFQTIFEADTISNHLPNNQAIGSKKNLFKSLFFYHTNITSKDPFSYIPKTYHINSLSGPQYQSFISQNQKDPSKIWIVKPGENTNRGKLIFLSQFKSISSLLTKSKQENTHEMTYIIQSYINRPLLYSGRKFDIRHFMLLTSVNGSLKAYWYRDGYVRTSSYMFDLENTQNLYIHLTNDAIQKTSELYEKYEPGNKVSYSEFQRYLEFGGNGKVRFQNILEKMKEIAKEIVLANYRVLDSKRMRNNFQIIGLDYMIDRDMKPWLIEANYNPCLEVNCLVLERIIPALLQNSFRIGLDPLFPPPCHYPPSKRFYLSDTPLKHLKYELIFDERDLRTPLINDYPFQQQKDKEEQFSDGEKQQ